MANFYRDNEDLRFYIERALPWDTLVPLAERGFVDPDGPRDVAEAVALYQDSFELLGEFIANEVAPRVATIDRAGVHLVDGEVVFPPELTAIFDQIRALDLHRMCLPRELGGMNLPFIAYAISCELFARADASIMAHFGFHSGIAMAMLLFSAREGTTRFDPETGRVVETRFAAEIEEIARGDAWGCMDITEPDAGSDMAALRTRGELDADGTWKITGEKIFITSGHGKYHFVIARTEPTPAGGGPLAGLGGLSIFLVPTYSDTPSGRQRHATVVRLEEKLGHHGSATATIRFDRTPAHLIGKRGEGFEYMLTMMNTARVGVGFESLGVCEAALRLARAYASERRSMGKTIDRHELIADALDSMEADVIGIRALAMEAAVDEELAQKLRLAAERGLTAPGLDARRAARDAAKHKRRARLATPLLKYIAAERAVALARMGLQIHGGVGYTREYGAEKLLRDAIVMPIYEGTSQIQALMAMKDRLGFALKNPQGFVRDAAQARWRALSARDPLERRVYRLRVAVHTAIRHLITRTATDKLKTLTGVPVTKWSKTLGSGWDPKRDFGYALLHAERLTQILVDDAIAAALWRQTQAFPERRPHLERHLERAEPRGRYLLDVISTTGDRLLTGLRAGADAAERNSA